MTRAEYRRPAPGRATPSAPTRNGPGAGGKVGRALYGRGGRTHSGPVRSGGGHPPRGGGKGKTSGGGGGRQFVLRHKLATAVILIAVVVVAVKMLVLQTIQAPGLAEQASEQRTVTEAMPALRGSILDRDGKPLAYTDDARALTFQPVKERAVIDDAHRKNPQLPDTDTRIAQIAQGVHDRLGGSVSAQDVESKLRSNDTFVYLARAISPATADQITQDFPEVGAERQQVRVYPGGQLAANLVGDVDFDGNGLIGLESSMDSVLAGTGGSQTYDRGSDGAVIPGSTRNVHPAVNGANVELTIDADTQYFVQNEVQKAKEMSRAKNASAVVLDAKTGEVLAMANDNTFDPSQPLDQQGKAELGDLPVTSPFEPGSVNKIITASAAIQYGLTNPDEVLQVPGSITMAGATVHDAWEHGTAPYTTTGVFGKSSNVGTLMLAQRVGEDRYAQMLQKFGLGVRTGVGLPAESGGSVPARSQWSGGTFANLPIGQGLSMSLLQMTGMYQAIANDGMRVPPRVIRSVSDTGEREQPAGVQVVSPQTARTVRDMFRAVIQNDPTGEQQGTGAKGAVPGYQISGKTGTAQQVDPACGCYSESSYNITFAGIAPADNPRYVVGIMLDAPTRSTDGSGGQSAAPLFSTIAGWMLQRNHVPLSAKQAPKLVLQAG
ncbi:peptidoglycan D,D-transpeptidase FtsI family protein [Williamsia sterculiae]|uniref:Cell division protein FtsI (Penicillin-binding protein 3) n=1 Tax=Williamsia sterculiae TaxID=1344003 RepID=A0A1N7H7G1_9NOCA|nr:penicillin-binding protein 2 [Williamsia sterculiae]SIS20598.1 cell division protein FtsI (penicillin-binding protein 3) [Williamsia sterculiae]